MKQLSHFVVWTVFNLISLGPFIASFYSIHWGAKDNISLSEVGIGFFFAICVASYVTEFVCALIFSLDEVTED